MAYTPEERIAELRAEVAELLEKAIGKDMQFAELSEFLNERAAIEEELRQEIAKLKADAG